MTEIPCPIRKNVSLWGWKRGKSRSFLDDVGEAEPGLRMGRLREAVVSGM